MNVTWVTAFLVVLTAMTASAAPLSEYLVDGVAPQAIVYRHVEDRDLKLQLFRPAAPSPIAGRPAIVLIHGGGWTAGEPATFFPHARYFASRGLVACSVEYRLLSSDRSTTLPDAIADCAAAITYLREHAKELGIDPYRIAVMGDSAGGHLAACLVTTIVPPAARADAAVLCNPITDLTDGDWFRFANGGALIAKNAPKTAATVDQLAKARDLSPLNHVSAGLPPTLILHGTDDRVVLPAQSVKFNDALKKSGNASQLELIQHARHAFVIPKYTASEATVVSAIRQADTFLASHGFTTGEPTLAVSDPPGWETPVRPAMQPKQ